MSDAIEAVKRTFFDRAAVQDAVDKATVRALSKMGAFHRRAQKSLVRYRKKVSEPGKPPSAHRPVDRTFRKAQTRDNRGRFLKREGVVRKAKSGSSAFRELMFFGYDASTKSVVSGPTYFKSQLTGKPIPETLEEGGTVVLEKPAPLASSRRAKPQQAAAYRRLLAEGRIEAPARVLVKRTFFVRARPSAKPALEQVKPKFADCFKNQVRGR